MIPFYMGVTLPLYALTIRTLGKNSTPTRERVEFLLRFVQDIPYGIPLTRSNSKVISGVFRHHKFSLKNGETVIQRFYYYRPSWLMNLDIKFCCYI